MVTVSDHPTYAYALADATNLYNRRISTATDILHASRSILWLKPDQIVIYDRATSGSTNRFKRFNLNLLTRPTISGTTAVATTPNGQQFVVQSLLPPSATLTASDAEAFRDVADMESTRYRLVIEDPTNPSDVRFLTVLQGVDSGGAPAPTQLLSGVSGTPFAGVVVGTTVVLFPVDLATPFASLSYTVPTTVTGHLITGLTPGGRYEAQFQRESTQMQVTLTPGSTYLADTGGVLWLGSESTLTVSLYLPLLRR